MRRAEFQSHSQSSRSRADVSANSIDSTTNLPGGFSDEVVELPQVLELPKRTGRDARVDTALPRMLAISDMVAIVSGLIIAMSLLALLGRDLNMFRVGVTAALLLPVWFSIAYMAGLYNLVELRISNGFVDEFGRVFIAVTAWSWLLLIIRMAFSAGPTSMLGPTMLWLAVILLVLSGRAVVRRVARRRSWFPSSIAVVGWPTESKIISDRVDRHPEWGLNIAAEFEFGRDDESGLEAMANRIGSLDVDRVMIIGGSEGLIDRSRLINLLVERGLLIDLVSGGAESLYSNSVLHDLEGLPVMSVRPSRLRPLDLKIKRVFDILVSSSGLLFVSPILIWAALRIKFGSKGPVFFRQQRCGFDGQPFEVLKFRTMVDGADNQRGKLRERAQDERGGDILFKLEDDPRVTAIGKTLRKWSIDELPQLWNVLKGEMSIVGPRPLPYDEADQATGMFSARNRVKPGLAGPWQANGRSVIPFADMIRLDYSYAVGWSLTEDIKLLFRTVVAVFSRRGAY